MANVTDSASLLTIPSGWDDGVLGSLKPDDGTGDFTFSRGADLSTTRVNENGYIEKGYENLLLQSNNFVLSPWGGAGFNLTPNQTGYDGSSDAWLMTSTAIGYAACRLTQGVSFSGVNTLSVYAKGGSVDFFGLRTNDGTVITWFELTGVGNASSNGIIEPLDNDWYRCSVYVAGSHSAYRIYIGSAFADYNVTTGDSIYIQDAMLNQGLVAYPYIQTTTAAAKSTTILEDQPRIDYSNGTNGNILVEPQRTNLMSQSELSSIFDSFQNLTKVDNAALSPEGVQNAMEFIPTTAFTGSHYCVTTNARSLIAGTIYTFSSYIKPNGFNYVQVGGYFGNEWAFFNLSTGTLISLGANASSGNIASVGNGWYRCDVTYTFQNAIGNFVSYVGFRIFENEAKSYYSGDGVKSIYTYGSQLEQDATSPSSYIPTYGTSTTRLKETATLTKNVASTGTIYINIEAQKSRTLTFLGANISVTAGTNKIAMSYSPTALKVSHNGSIVANTARTFDTASLTQIQLGHRNNFEQTTDGINQFLTLDSFLSDADLNALTI